MGIGVFGDYGLAPMSIIDSGLIAFHTGDAGHDRKLIFEALRTVSDKPVRAIIHGHSHTCFGAGCWLMADGGWRMAVKPSSAIRS